MKEEEEKKGADVSVCAHTTCVHTHRHALTAWASFSLVSPSEYNITTLPDIYRLSLGYTYRFSHMYIYTRSVWYACCGWGQQANPSWPKSAFLLGYDSKRKKGATVSFVVWNFDSRVPCTLLRTRENILNALDFSHACGSSVSPWKN
jgi:hypothetical protein